MKKCLICEKQFSPWDSTTKYCSRRCSGIAKKGENNVNWVGDKVSRTAIHEWVRNRIPDPCKCTQCGSDNKGKALDLANISQEYKRDLLDWEYLCRKCHMLKDGRLKTLRQLREAKYLPLKNCLTCYEVFKPKGHATKKYCSRTCYDKSRRRPVNQYDKNMRLVKHWDTSQDVESRLGIRVTTIAAALAGRCKTAGGFIWRN